MLTSEESNPSTEFRVPSLLQRTSEGRWIDFVEERRFVVIKSSDRKCRGGRWNYRSIRTVFGYTSLSFVCELK